MASIEQIKELRESTGVSIIECKKALEESAGDMSKAKELLRKWGKDTAQKKSTRATGQGIVDCYIHPNKKVGVLLDLRCETDFVAKSPDFLDLSHEIVMQIAAMKPIYVKETDIPLDVLEEEKKVYKSQVEDANKPENILNQILEGKLKKFKEQVSLLSQPWVKEDKKTIKNVVDEYISKLGENIEVRNFVRFEI